jgi:hypothetical protein
MESLTFRPEPFRFERDLDAKWFTDRAGAITRARTLHQTYTTIAIIKRSDGNYQVDFRDKLPKSSTYPFDDKLTFTLPADVVQRAQTLRAYGYTVTTKQRAGKWYCEISAVATGGPALPTTKGPDAGFEFDKEESAKKRAARLALVGFGVKTNKRVDGKWQVEITNLPTYVATASTSATSSTSSTVKSPTPSSTGSKTTTTATTPHKLEVINAGDSHKLSDAVVQSFRDFAAEVFSLTDQHIDATFGDTVRSLATKANAAKSSDAFSWHKTGRAVDIDQSPRWVIRSENRSGDTYFILFLRHKDLKATTGVRFFPAGTTHYYSWYGVTDPKHPYVNVTEIAKKYGWERIKAQTGYGLSPAKAYNKQEWWHYEKRDSLTWFQALQEIYTDAQITTGVKAFASTNKHSARLRREGFSDTALKAVFPLVKKGNLEIRCTVGKDAANLADDVKAVQAALVRGAKLPAGAATGTLDAATQTAINTVQATLGGNDGVIDVGLKLHQELGKL